MRPKDIGTEAETRVVNYLRLNGFAQAERRALHGGKDLGDVTGCGPLVIEIKGGDKARMASDGQIDNWLIETEIERANADADLGLLVVARARKGVAAWWCCMTMRTYERLLNDKPVDREPLASLAVRTTLANAVTMLRARGWGDAL